MFHQLDTVEMKKCLFCKHPDSNTPMPRLTQKKAYHTYLPEAISNYWRFKTVRHRWNWWAPPPQKYCAETFSGWKCQYPFKLWEHFTHPGCFGWEIEDKQSAHLQCLLPFSTEEMLDLPPSSSSFFSFCQSKMELLPCGTILKACGCFVNLDVPDNVCMRISQYLIIRKN